MVVLACGWILASELALAQQVELTPAVHARLLELLSLNCGTDAEVLRFRLAISQIGGAAEPLLLEVLERGIAPEVRKTAEAEFARQYALRQAWLAKNGARLFAEDAARLARRDQADFVADNVRRVDASHKQNALRALAEIGSAAAIPTIRAAAGREAHLAAPAEDAIVAISRRASRKLR
jgi:hypothetical protein